ncbi:MAG: DUF2280 domain-containing protein [Methylophilus sp.]|jgi:hypothetical protein
MAALKENVKLFIIQQLACFNTPTEVADAVKEEFDVDLPRAQVAIYNPTNFSGRELGVRLKEYFFQKRKEFLENVEAIPMANANVRINELNKMYFEVRKRKNYPLALQISEQIAKETSGFYTNKGTAGGGLGGAFIQSLSNFNGGSLPIVEEIEGEFTEVKDVKPEKKVITKKPVKKVDWNAQ